MHELLCCITEKETCGDLSQYTMFSQNLFSLYILFLQFILSLWKCQACWDLCGWHLLHRDLRYLRSVVTLVKHWAVWEWLVRDLGRCLAGFGAGPGTQVALDHFGKSTSHLTCVTWTWFSKKEKRNKQKNPLRCHCDGLYSCKHSQPCSCSPVQGFGHEARAQPWSVCVKYCALSFTKKRSVWCRHWSCCVYVPKRGWVKEVMTVVCVEGLKLWLLVWRIEIKTDLEECSGF